MKIVILLIGLLSIKDCNNINKQNHLGIEKNALSSELNGAYTITTILENDVSSYHLEVNFNSKEHKITGFAGCNRFFGNYVLTDDSLQFGAIGSTKMSCDEEKNNIEMTLFETLSKVNGVSYINDHTINLLNGETTVLTIRKNSQENEFIFEYSALSRGLYKNIIIDNTNMSVINERNSKPLTKPCNKKQWSLLLEMAQKIDLETISNLKAPSAKRLYDGAAIGNLTITLNGKRYKSSSFDHGNPPDELAAIVKEILSMSENIE